MTLVYYAVSLTTMLFFCISKQNMNQNTNNLITKHGFYDKNVYNFHNCLKLSLGILYTVANVCKVRSHGSKES